MLCKYLYGIDNVRIMIQLCKIHPELPLGDADVTVKIAELQIYLGSDFHRLHIKILSLNIHHNIRLALTCFHPSLIFMLPSPSAGGDNTFTAVK